MIIHTRNERPDMQANKLNSFIVDLFYLKDS